MSGKTTLLLADDDPAVTDSLAPFLERAGFHVLVVADGTRALEKVAALRPDLLLLDVLMPGLDGREVLRRLRASGSKAPVLVLTARDAVSDTARRGRRHDGALVARAPGGVDPDPRGRRPRARGRARSRRGS